MEVNLVSDNLFYRAEVANNKNMYSNIHAISAGLDVDLGMKDTSARENLTIRSKALFVNLFPFSVSSRAPVRCLRSTLRGRCRKNRRRPARHRRRP